MINVRRLQTGNEIEIKNRLKSKRENERMWSFPLQEIDEAIIFNTSSHTSAHVQMPLPILASNSTRQTLCVRLYNFFNFYFLIATANITQHNTLIHRQINKSISHFFL